jgi:putative phosphoesterase
VKVAVLSDIHSNCFALQAVIEEMTAENPDALIVLGDTFGYYPWALETYRCVHKLHPLALLGNHDKLVIETDPPPVETVHWEIAKQNEQDLVADLGALLWLRELLPKREWTIGGTQVLCCHGTPDDPLNGRYYPDDSQDPPWRPKANDVLLMGHTHYPLVRTVAGGGLIANPGSVGQPRDGDLRASWGLFYPLERRFELRRTRYDVEGTIEKLRELGWHSLAIEALRKSYRGPLKRPGNMQ